MSVRLHPYLLSPDAGEGGTPTPDATPAGKPEPADTVAILLQKNAELERKLVRYDRDNLKQRDEIRTLKERAPQAPDPELASLLDAYRSLGKPEEIQALRSEREQLAQRLAGLERDEALRTVAERAGYKFSVLRQIVPPTAALEFAKAKKDGKDTDVLTVRDGEGEPVPFAERYADFLPALQPNGQPQQPKVPGTPPRGAQLAPHVDIQPARELSVVDDLRSRGFGSF